MNQKLKIEIVCGDIGFIEEHAKHIGFRVGHLLDYEKQLPGLTALVDLDKGWIYICSIVRNHTDRQPTDRVLWDLEDWLSVEMVAYEIKFPAGGESVYAKGFSHVLQYLREQDLNPKNPKELEITAIHIRTADLDE